MTSQPQPDPQTEPAVSWKTGVIWMGAGLPTLWRLLVAQRFRIGWRAIPAYACDAGCAAFNSALGAVHDALLSRSLRRVTLDDDPVFVLGHWRSGTTLTHELLALDSRHRSPTNYECFVPHHFLISQRWLKPCIRFVLPKTRLADAMPVAWDLPQEDEFALLALGAPSPYQSIAFPNEPQRFDACCTLDELSLGERLRWERTWQRFLRRLIRNRPGRLVLKSPTHTFRLPILEQLFPRARYVHIVRDPYAVFASTVKLWRSLFAAQSYQRPTHAGLEERILTTFCRMYDRFESARSQVAPGRIYDVRFEDLVRDPLGQVRQIYQRLDLGEYDSRAIQTYMAQRAGHRADQYSLSPEQHAAVTRRWLPYMRKYGYTESRDATDPA